MTSSSLNSPLFHSSVAFQALPQHAIPSFKFPIFSVICDWTGNPLLYLHFFAHTMFVYLASLFTEQLAKWSISLFNSQCKDSSFSSNSSISLLPPSSMPPSQSAAPSYESTSDAFARAYRFLSYAPYHHVLPEPKRNFAGQHLFTNTLKGPQQIEEYRLFYDTHTRTTTALVRFGENMCGHPGLVHGGATAAVIDELCGSAYDMEGLGKGFTANLNVNYRKPLPNGSEVIVHAWVHRKIGRKVFIDGKNGRGA